MIAGEPTYIPPKTKGSRRTAPLPAATTTLLRNYLKRPGVSVGASAVTGPDCFTSAGRPTAPARGESPGSRYGRGTKFRHEQVNDLRKPPYQDQQWSGRRESNPSS